MPGAGDVERAGDPFGQFPDLGPPLPDAVVPPLSPHHPHHPPGHASSSAHACAFSLVLYDQPLHPAHLPPVARRALCSSACSLEGWILAGGGHMVRVQTLTGCVVELICPAHGNRPTRGRLATLPCQGEQTLRRTLPVPGVRYVASAVAETQPEHIFARTWTDTLTLAHDTRALLAGSGPQGRSATVPPPTPAHPLAWLSALQVSHPSGQVHIEGTHLLRAGLLVLQTTTILHLL